MLIPHTVELDQNQSSVKALQPQGTAGPRAVPLVGSPGESGWLNPAARGRAVSGAQVRSGWRAGVCRLPADRWRGRSR